MNILHLVAALISVILVLGAHLGLMFSWRAGFAPGTGKYAKQRQTSDKEKYLPGVAGIGVGLISVYLHFFDSAAPTITRFTAAYPMVEGLLMFVFVYGIGFLCFSRWLIGQCVAFALVLIAYLL